MAVIAVFGEDRLDLPVEGDLLRHSYRHLPDFPHGSNFLFWKQAIGTEFLLLASSLNEDRERQQGIVRAAMKPYCG
jgi:hypothetical protein